MIQSTLLAGLGFLSACLLFLFVAPAFWARAVRLTTQKLRNSLPVSEAEVRASQDLIRAQYAVKVHQLSKLIEKSRLAAHRQTIEINRRDAAITKLQADIVRLSLDLAEHQNAHGVLKQTINDRLPKLEGGIEDARRLLEARDGDIRLMEQDRARQLEALAEARQIHAQQASEIERLRQAMATAQGQDRRRAMDMGGDAEFALRSELDSLRVTARSQAATINRLQAQLSNRAETGQLSLAGAHDTLPAPGAQAADDAPEIELSGDEAVLRGRVAEQAAEIRQLRRELAQSQDMTHVDTDQLVLLQQIRGLEAKTRDQSDENRRLRDEIDRLQAVVTPDTLKAVAESKSFLKSRLEKMELQHRSERETTGRLRAELASANERAARQALYFRDELRRLGTRTLTPVTSGGRSSRKAETAATPAPASEVSSAPVTDLAAVRAAQGGADEVPAKVDRRAIWAARFLPAPAPPRDVLHPRDPAAASDQGPVSASAVIGEPGAAALTAGTETVATGRASATIDPSRRDGSALASVPGIAPVLNGAPVAEADAPARAGDEPSDLAAADKRGRLLDRLRSYEDAS